MADDRAGSKKYKKDMKDRVREKSGDDDLDEEEPDFSDPDDFVDKITEEELLGDLLKQRPKETDGIDSVVVVDNIPQVGPEKQEKLKSMIRKIFGKFGKIQTEYFPMENDLTKGYCFLEFQNAREAMDAVTATNGYKLDKQHTFAVNPFTDFDKCANVLNDWVPPAPTPYSDQGNLLHWLMDPRCVDQFSVIYEGGERTAIYQNMPGEPVSLQSRQRWTETYVRWSPRGTYLATFHQKGVALWGGEAMKQIVRFSHPGVQLSDFSPCERYMVTFSSAPETNKEDPTAIIIWDLRTGYKKRGFLCDNASAWPVFKWSYDGSYFARMSQDTLSIYETPSFGMLDKKSIKIKGLKDFAWSPTDNIISYWTCEEGDLPARVTLIEIPSRATLCTKNLFAVADCKLHWQKSGQYLCVKVDRYKSKKEEKEKETVKYAGIFHSFYVFRIKEKEIPVDTVEVKESITAFAWEPVGHRFACIHGETPRIGVSFYNVRKGGTVELIKTLDKRSVNHLFWSPNGQFIVLAGLRGMNGILEFVDTADMTVMMQAEHFMATDVEWDPTGRYVATIVSWWGHKVDNAYWLWNFQGKLLCKQPLDRVCQLQWRPRPPSLLSADQLKEIKKNMKKYNTMFGIEDKMRESKASKEQIEKRRSEMESFKQWQQICDKRYREEKMQRLKLRNNVDTDAIESYVAEETIEFLVNVEEFVIDDEE
jgi:translation initiation factor 3 subunit B